MHAHQIAQAGFTSKPIRAVTPRPQATPAAGAQLRALVVTAGAYCLTGHTATGTRPRVGSIAVDPAVIPLGSHLYVTGYGYGYAVDTGGALRGGEINVWEPCHAARAWGMRQVTVYILPH